MKKILLLFTIFFASLTSFANSDIVGNSNGNNVVNIISDSNDNTINGKAGRAAGAIIGGALGKMYGGTIGAGIGSLTSSIVGAVGGYAIGNEYGSIIGGVIGEEVGDVVEDYVWEKGKKIYKFIRDNYFIENYDYNPARVYLENYNSFDDSGNSNIIYSEDNTQISTRKVF